MEEQTFGDLLDAVRGGWEVEVLDHTGQVAEPDIDEFDVVLRYVVDEFFSRREHLGLLVRVRWPFVLTTVNLSRRTMKW